MKIARQGTKGLRSRNKGQNPTEIEPDSYKNGKCITGEEAKTINECDAHKNLVCISESNESPVPAVGSFTE